MIQVLLLFILTAPLLSLAQQESSTVVEMDVHVHGEAKASVRELTDYQKKEQEIQEKERRLLAEIYKMTSRQRKLASQKADQLQKREELEADVAELQKDIAKVTEEMSLLRKKVIVRIRNLHRVSTPTIFQSLFGAHDLIEMDRNARIMYKISKSDIEQLRTFRGLKNLLNQQQQNLQSKILEFEKTQKKLEKQEVAIKTTYLAQMMLLKDLDHEDKTILRKLKNLKKNSYRNSHQRANTADTLFEEGIYEHKGRLELPLVGVVSQRFGLYRLPTKKIRIYNKGWFISTIPQKEVNVVYKGQAVYVGPFGDYNNVVIVDHGDHFYSVYANLVEVNVAMGQDLETQSLIGKVDQSRLFGHGLYFELRHFSQPEDPAEWFKDSGINISSLKEQNI